MPKKTDDLQNNNKEEEQQQNTPSTHEDKRPSGTKDGSDKRTWKQRFMDSKFGKQLLNLSGQTVQDTSNKPASLQNTTGTTNMSLSTRSDESKTSEPVKQDDQITTTTTTTTTEPKEQAKVEVTANQTATQQPENKAVQKEEMTDSDLNDLADEFVAEEQAKAQQLAEKEVMQRPLPIPPAVQKTPAAQPTAQQEAARKEAEEQAKVEQAKKLAEEQANVEQARKEAEDKARKDAEDKKHLEEEQAKKLAEEKAKVEQARKDAEDKKRLEEEQKRKDAATKVATKPAPNQTPPAQPATKPATPVTPNPTPPAQQPAAKTATPPTQPQVPPTKPATPVTPKPTAPAQPAAKTATPPAQPQPKEVSAKDIKELESKITTLQGEIEVLDERKNTFPNNNKTEPGYQQIVLDLEGKNNQLEFLQKTLEGLKNPQLTLTTLDKSNAVPHVINAANQLKELANSIEYKGMPLHMALCKQIDDLLVSLNDELRTEVANHETYARKKAKSEQEVNSYVANALGNSSAVYVTRKTEEFLNNLQHIPADAQKTPEAKFEYIQKCAEQYKKDCMYGKNGKGWYIAKQIAKAVLLIAAMAITFAALNVAGLGIGFAVGGPLGMAAAFIPTVAVASVITASAGAALGMRMFKSSEYHKRAASISNAVDHMKPEVLAPRKV